LLFAADLTSYLEPRIELRVYHTDRRFVYNLSGNHYADPTTGALYENRLGLQLTPVGDYEQGQMVILTDRNSKFYLYDVIERSILMLLGNSGDEAIQALCEYTKEKEKDLIVYL
jgi:hypothetical protein